MRIPASIGSALLLSVVASAQSDPNFIQANAPHSWPSTAAITTFLTKEFKKEGAPGMAVAIVQNGKVVYAQGLGFADLQNEVPVKPNTVFRLGSITKQFTATMVMQLVQEGKLSLEESLGSLLPSAPKAWAAVTVRQLLSHTAGIPNYTATPTFIKMIRDDVTVDHINDGVVAKPLDFPAGSDWNYSNSGYILLGQIIEKVTGHPFADELHKRILDPLGMSQTYFVRENTVIKHRASGYSTYGGQIKQSVFINMDWPFAAGSMESTVLDLAKWDAALYGDKILPQASLAQMWTPIKLTSGKTHDYGFGWSLQTVNGIKTINHGGGIPGFATFIDRVPSIGTTAIALSNTDTSSPEDVVKHLLAFLDHRLQPLPTLALPDKDPATTSLIRRGLESLFAGKPDPALFSDGMMKIFTPQMISSIADTGKALGSLKSMKLTLSEDKDGVKTREYMISFENDTLSGHFQVGKTGLIEDARVR